MIDAKSIYELHQACKHAQSWPIKFPPDSEETIHKCMDIATDLQEHRLNFEIKNNPIHLMRAFRRAWEADFDIPIWVLCQLYVAFIDYEKFDGKKTLDELLKVRGRGLRGSIANRFAAEGKEKDISNHIKTLRDIGFSLKISCKLVSYRSHEIAQVNLSEPRINDIYKKYTNNKEQVLLGFIWGDELANKKILFNYLYENGFIIDESSECEILKCPKTYKSYLSILYKKVLNSILN